MILSQNTALWNGAIEAALTLLGAGAALSAGYLTSYRGGLLTLTICSFLEGGAILTAAQTNSLWLSYLGYIAFGVLYMFMITIARWENLNLNILLELYIYIGCKIILNSFVSTFKLLYFLARLVEIVVSLCKAWINALHWMNLLYPLNLYYIIRIFIKIKWRNLITKAVRKFSGLPKCQYVYFWSGVVQYYWQLVYEVY